MSRSADAAPAGDRAGAGSEMEWRPAPGHETGFEQAMRLAIAEAERGGDTDVPVGAVVLNASETVIARAVNRKEADGDPTAHAELLALRSAARAVGSWRLIGCTLVVTLEPCTMCAGAVTASRVDRLVFGAADPKAGAVGSLWDVVSDRRLNHHPEVIGGVLADECGALLRKFFANRRRPSRDTQP
jgi:tRNA(adenine34) deaminase